LQVLSRNTITPRIIIYGNNISRKGDLISLFLGKKGISLDENSKLPIRLDYERQKWGTEFIIMNSLEENADKSAIDKAVDYFAEKSVDLLVAVMPSDDPTFTQKDISFMLSLRESYLKRSSNIELPVVFIRNSDNPDRKPLSWDMPLELKAFKNISYIPVCTKWDSEEERRANFEDAAFAIYQLLPDMAKAAFAVCTNFTSLKLNIARNLTWTTALSSASTCFIPAPAFDLSMARYLNANLVELLARIGDKNINKAKAAGDFINYLNPYSFSKTLSLVNNQFAKVTGPIGLPANLFNAAAFMTISLGIGEATGAYFIERRSIEAAKVVYEKKNAEYRNKFGKTALIGGINPGEFYIGFKRISDEYNAALDISGSKYRGSSPRDTREIPIVEFV
jgi:hypothetical protein